MTEPKPRFSRMGTEFALVALGLSALAVAFGGLRVSRRGQKRLQG